MALHATPKDHDADPPSGWIVRKSGSHWHLESAKGGVIGTFTTKREAMAARESGFYFDLYNKEGRWFAGESVSGWVQY
mgnify:CR=1 FL=1